MKNFIKKGILIGLFILFPSVSFAYTTTINFIIPGSHTWIAPSGVTSVDVACWGGGGGGGDNANNGGGGGGGGAFASSTVSVTPNNSYTVIVGSGGSGAGSSSSAAGSDGSASSFNTTSVIAAAGGGGGVTSSGAGGTTAASTGTTKYAGGNGGTPSNTYDSGGGGGGSAGPNGAGGTGGNGSGSGGTGGTGDNSLGGIGGDATASGSHSYWGAGGGGGGNNGTSGGSALTIGGGGGGGEGGGGNGSSGMCSITYSTSDTTEMVNSYTYGSSGISSLSGEHPFDTQSGDIIFTFITVYTNSLSSAPSGWTLIDSETINTSYKYYLYYQMATSTNRNGETWTLSGSSYAQITQSSFRGGFDSLTPIQATSTGTYASYPGDYKVRSNSITTTQSNSHLIWIGGKYDSYGSIRAGDDGDGSGQFIQAPTSPMQFATSTNKGFVNSDRWYHAIFKGLWSSNGNTGAVDATVTEYNAYTGYAYLIALTPTASSITLQPLLNLFGDW